jgi:hypothetical protein
MATPKLKYDCNRCDKKFATINDKMSHWVTEHDRGFVKRGERTLRPTSCWRCAGEIPRYQNTCACGWVHPYIIQKGPKTAVK